MKKYMIGLLCVINCAKAAQAIATKKTQERATQTENDDWTLAEREKNVMATLCL